MPIPAPSSAADRVTAVIVVGQDYETNLNDLRTTLTSDLNLGDMLGVQMSLQKYEVSFQTRQAVPQKQQKVVNQVASEVKKTAGG